MKDKTATPQPEIRYGVVDSGPTWRIERFTWSGSSWLWAYVTGEMESRSPYLRDEFVRIDYRRETDIAVYAKRGLTLPLVWLRYHWNREPWWLILGVAKRLGISGVAPGWLAEIFTPPGGTR